MASARCFWLMKSEPAVYSIDDLQRDGRSAWEGVRNYQARNYMRDDMRVGDGILFYHSGAQPPGVAGIARVCRSAYPDDSAWDRKGKYFDARSTPEAPLWLMVDIEFVECFPEVVSLNELKSREELAGMEVLRRGQRLSIMPVTAEHFRLVARLGRRARSP